MPNHVKMALPAGSAFIFDVRAAPPFAPSFAASKKRLHSHGGSAHWVMAEVVERITGLDFRDVLRSRVLDPSGLTGFFVGMPEEVQPQYELAGLIAANPATDRQRAMIEEAKSDPSKRPMGGGVAPALGMPGGGGYCTA